MQVSERLRPSDGARGADKIVRRLLFAEEGLVSLAVEDEEGDEGGVKVL